MHLYEALPQACLECMKKEYAHNERTFTYMPFQTQ